MRIALKFTFILVVSLLVSSTGLAQDSGIQGVVSDASLAVVPGAEVTVTNLATEVARTAISNDQGYYSVPLLPAGNFRVNCSLSGFTTQETEVLLQVGHVARVNFQLEVGQVAQVVEVTAEAAQLQSKTTDVGQVIDEKRVAELPLNGRNYLNLARLSAGVVRSAQGGRGHRGEAEGAFQAAGIHIAQNNILLDGVDNSSRISTIFQSPLTYQVQAVKPSVDAVGEFKVITNNVSAEHGYRMGAKVLVSTKSGTNAIHGTLFNFHRNDVAGANNFFFNRNNQDKPKFIRNQFGGTVGGPIVRNKTFFFFSYEGTRLRRGVAGALSTVPTQAVRSGDFSGEPGGSARNADIFDPATLVGEGEAAQRSQFPGNVIPQNRFDPVAVTLASFYPLPNLPGNINNYFNSPGAETDADQFDVRVDHNFNDAHRIFGRLSSRDLSILDPPRLPPPAFGSSGILTALEAQNLAINYNSTISTTMLNELRFGFSRVPSAWALPDVGDLTNESIGLFGSPGGTEPGTAVFAINGYTRLGPPGDTPKTDNLRGYHIVDNVLWDRGDHSLKFGFEHRSMRIERRPAGWARGWLQHHQQYTSEFPNVGASRAATGNGMATLLLGMIRVQSIGTPTGEISRVPYYGAYIQDDWRITPKLTLNLGLRYELFDGPYYPGDQPQISRMQWTGDITDETQDLLPIEFGGFVFPKNGSDCGCKRDTNNFAPRIGLAYRVTNNTVIRAGAGLFYGEANSAAFEAGRFQEGPPNAIIEQNLLGSREQPITTLSNGVLPLVISGPEEVPAPFSIVRVTPEEIPQMYTGQWFLDVQHQLPANILMTVGYNGSSTSFINWWRIISYGLGPHPTVRAQARRRTAGPLNDIIVNYPSNVLNSNYNAFTFRAEKRFSDGLTFLSSFTWSKILDYGREIATNGLGGASSGGVSQFVRDMWMNRGRADFDRTLNYNFSFLYELPAGPGRGRFESGPASWVLGGWQVGGIMTLLSGVPLDNNFSPDTQNSGGRFRGDRIGDPNLSESQRTVDRWFNTGAYGPTAQDGMFGNAGRGLIDAPGWKNFDFTLSKNFYTPWEDQHVQFRFESFNFTNTPHFGPPNLVVGSPFAGTINLAEDARTIQFALKYVF